MSQRTHKRKVTPEHMARAARLPQAEVREPIITSCWPDEQPELQAENAQCGGENRVVTSGREKEE